VQTPSTCRKLHLHNIIYKTIGENGLLKQSTKRLLEQAMQAELTEHLGYEKHAPKGKNSGIPETVTTRTPFWVTLAISK
jgi:transposase-like protein